MPSFIPCIHIGPYKVMTNDPAQRVTRWRVSIGYKTCVSERRFATKKEALDYAATKDPAIFDHCY